MASDETHSLKMLPHIKVFAKLELEANRKMKVHLFKHGGGGENINSVPASLVDSFQSLQSLRPTKVLSPNPQNDQTQLCMA